MGYIVLPQIQDTSRRVESRCAKIAESGRRSTKRILIVEDGEDIVKIIRSILEREGFEVAATHDGPHECPKSESRALT